MMPRYVVVRVCCGLGRNGEMIGRRKIETSVLLEAVMTLTCWTWMSWHKVIASGICFIRQVVCLDFRSM
jgi:hypothetical protein